MFSTRSRQAYIKGSLAAALASLSLAGCGGGVGGGGAATADLQWSIFDVDDASRLQSLTCEGVGANAVVLTMTSLASGTTYTDNFLCRSYGGVSATVPAGNYDLTATLYGDATHYGNSTTVLDTTPAPNQPLYAGNNPFATIEFLVNSFVLDWTIASGGVATSCEYVGAAKVELDVWFPGQTAPTQYLLPCSNASYVTSTGTYSFATLAIPYGSYSVQWQAFLLDASKNKLGPGTLVQTYNVSPDVQAFLGTVPFAL